MLKIDGLLFTIIFHAHIFLCNNTKTFRRIPVQETRPPRITQPPTDSFISSLATSNTSTSTETNATNTSTNNISTADPNETTNVCTTAETTRNASTMTDFTVIGIGSIIVFTVVVIVLLVAAVYYCRRKQQSNSGANISMNNTGLYETHNEVLSQDNYDQIIRITYGRENNIMGRVYNNEEPEYLRIIE